MQICNKQKYCNTNLVIASVKKQIVTQGKRQTRNINACKKQLSTQTQSAGKKMHNIAVQGESKPGQRRQQHFLEKRKFFLNKKKLKFDWWIQGM